MVRNGKGLCEEIKDRGVLDMSRLRRPKTWSEIAPGKPEPHNVTMSHAKHRHCVLKNLKHLKQTSAVFYSLPWTHKGFVVAFKVRNLNGDNDSLKLVITE